MIHLLRLQIHAHKGGHPITPPQNRKVQPMRNDPTHGADDGKGTQQVVHGAGGRIDRRRRGSY